MKRKIISFLMILIILSTIFIFGQTDEELKKWEKQVWRLSIVADYPELFPQAVQFAVFDENPLETKICLMSDKLRKIYMSELEEKKSSFEYDITKTSQMFVIWDSMFRDITGDEVYLLPTVLPPGNDINYGFTLSSNARGGKKWLVTRMASEMASDKERIVCWLIPLNLKKGKETKITLNKDNTYDWERDFNMRMFNTADDKNKTKKQTSSY